MDNVLVSVAMTTYNGSKYLKEQIESILLQTVNDFELIICDDCSTDNTLEIISSYAQKDKRIRFYENKENLGYVKNFEKAISLCNGQYIALSDQDDIWMSDHLSILLTEIKTEQLSLVGGNALLVDSENKDLHCKLINNNNLPEKKEDFENMLLYRNVFQGAAILFDKEILNKALPFPEGLKYHDWWLALVASECNGVKYINEPVLRYRQHGNNVTGNHERDSVKKKLLKFCKNDLQEYGKRNFSILNKFINVTKKKEIVIEASSFAKSCMLQELRAISYYIKHHKEIYFRESPLTNITRISKMILNCFYAKSTKKSDQN